MGCCPNLGGPSRVSKAVPSNMRAPLPGAAELFILMLKANSMATPLCPAQQRAYDGLVASLPVSDILVLQGDAGMGKTTVLHELHRHAGGVYLTVKEFIDAMRSRHPLALEETFEQWVREALTAHQTVLLDDFHLITNVTE